MGPYDPTTDYIEIKAYYQWVPFVLFFQGVLFYVPHMIFKILENGKIKVTMVNKNRPLLNGSSFSCS